MKVNDPESIARLLEAKITRCWVVIGPSRASNSVSRYSNQTDIESYPSTERDQRARREGLRPA